MRAALLVLVGCGGEPPCAPVLLHADRDGDGAGDPLVTQVVCPSAGWVATDDDCDDGRPDVGPRVAEVCNGRDDDCDGEVDEEVLTLRWLDRDGDGFGDAGAERPTCLPDDPAVAAQAGDCDDLAATVHPGAEELCDGRDTDCDGVAETGPPQWWYADADLDGWGDEATGEHTCLPAAGRVLAVPDCDDADPAVHPGADERCDDRDEDCDGAVDEEPIDPARSWPDADGDGAGDQRSVPTLACDAPPGAVPSGDDCDDGDAAVHVGADERCGGADEDCDGLVDDADPGVVDPIGWSIDVDGDGYGPPVPGLLACLGPAGFGPATDCDDADGSVSPGAEERCNGVDDDCDAGIDLLDPDGPPADALVWYPDADLDGFGGIAGAAFGCGGPGLLHDGGDCDDDDPAAHPDGVEVCGGGDEDCDLLLDDADPGLAAWSAGPYFADADGDGVGVAPQLGLACVVPAGTSPVLGDCDDADPRLASEVLWLDDLDGDGYGVGPGGGPSCSLPLSAVVAGSTLDCDDADPVVHPHQFDPCGDGEDTNCDGMDECRDLALDELVELQRSDPFDDAGESLAGVGDLDGDGQDDLLIGASSSNGGDGGAWLVLGPITADLALPASPTVLGTVGLSETGAAVAGGGDLDGDGFPDVVLGAPHTGRVYVVHGPDIGGRVTVGLTIDGPPNTGTAVLLPGDLDGDELPDLVIANEAFTLGCPVGASYCGAVYVLRGPALATDVAYADATWLGAAYDEHAGTSVAAAGDTDGDGIRELWIGTAPYAERGRVYLAPYASGITDLALATDGLWGEVAADKFGAAVAGGVDLDDDGHDDVVVGAPLSDRGDTDAGAAFVVLGPVEGIVDAGTAAAIVDGVNPGGRAGSAIAAHGADVLVGAPETFAGLADAGSIYLLRSPVSGTISVDDADVVITSTSAVADLAGGALAAAGDLDGDGVQDWVIGSREHATGAAWILFGP